MGGLSKKGFQIDKIVADSGLPHLCLDAGGLLFKQTTLTPGQEKLEKLTAAAIAEAYSAMGFAAVAVGPQDLAAGSAFLQSLAQQGKGRKFVWLSANLVDKATNKPLVKAYTSFKVGRLKVGVIGLTGPTNLRAEDRAVLRPWDEVLPNLVAKVAKRCNLVILLSNLPAADNQRLATATPAIHLILQAGAGGNTVPQAPVGNALIAAALPQGKQLGVLDITWQVGRQWETPAQVRLRQTREALSQVVSQLAQFPGRDQETALHDQPERLKTWQTLQARGQALRNEVDTLERQTAPSPAGTTPCTYSNRFVDLDSRLPDQPGIKAILDRLDRERGKLLEQQARRLTAPVAPSPYLGHPACGTCHPAQLAAWQRTKHAKAYLTLTLAKQQMNPACLPCHVTGVVGPEQAAEAMNLSDDRRGVGCETCHGPGRRHSQSPQTTPLTKRPAPEVCLPCHRPPHDPAFDFERRLKQVNHQ